MHIAAGHAAVGDIADDRDPQAFQLCAMIENGARVEQGLRRMLMCAVARIDDRDAQMALQEVRAPDAE